MFKQQILTFLLLMSAVGNAAGVDPSLRAPSLPTIDVMTNGSFEARKAAWSASSAPTFTINTSTPLNGGASGVFTATGSSQTVTSAQYPIVVGLKGNNCAASLIYQSSELTNFYSVEVIDGSSNVLAGPVQVPYSPITSPLSLPFQCPSSGTMAVRILSSGSALSFTYDDVTLGTNKLIQISQSTLWGSITWPIAASCVWSVSNGTFQNFASNSNCSTPTVTGNLAVNTSSPTATPSFQLNNLPEGNYFMTVSGSMYKTGSAGASAFYIMSDGVSGWGATGISTTPAGSNGSGTLVGQINYSSTGNQIINLMAYVSNVSDSANIDVSQVPFTIAVYRYPTQTELAVRPDTINWVVDALSNNGGPLNLGTGTTSLPTDIQSGALNVTSSGSLPALQPCTVGPATGSTCSAGVGSLGVAFNLPATQDVLACAQFSHHLTTSATDTPQTAFGLYETDQNNTTQLQGGSYAPQDAITAGSSAIGVEHPFNLCERMHFTSAGLKYLRLNFGQVAGGGIAVSELLSSPPVHWIIKPLTQNVPAPILVGSVSSSSAGVERLERANIAACSSDPCTINSGTPGISVVNWNATGQYTVHFATGTFSATPVCFFTNTDATNKAYATTQGGAYSNLLYTVEFDLPTPAASDVSFDVMCLGPK